MADDSSSAMVLDHSDSFDDEFALSEVVRILDENPAILDIINEFSLTRQDNSSFGHSQAIVSNNPQVGPSKFRGETSHQQGVPQPDNYDSGFGNPMQPAGLLSGSWIRINCSCCQVLREIIHTKEMHVTKLEIHGRLGLIISHAILENRLVNSDSTTQSQHYQMLDFCNQSMQAIRENLVQYCEGRKRDGYIMQQDPLLKFYDALCVGSTHGGGDDGLDAFDDFFQPSPADDSGREHQVNQPESVNQTGATRDEVRLTRSTSSSIAAQRERTRKLTVKDLIRYFHLPIEVAANQMQVCPTVMKKICRKHGLQRWPHRKIKSIENKISSRKASLDGSDAEEKARAQHEIESLQRELANIFTTYISN